MKLKRLSSKTIFAGPSLGMSIICTLPLIALKLLSILDISWIWISCPIWFGWIVCFALWLWFSSLNVICRAITPPIVIPLLLSNIEVDDAKLKKEEKEEGDKENGM
jgi:hypothetical protein